MSIIFPQSHTITNSFFNYISQLPLLPNPMFWESNYLNISSSLIQTLFIQYLEYIDQQFFDSQERKYSYYSKDKQPRTIVTLFGNNGNLKITKMDRLKITNYGNFRQYV